MMIYKTLIKLSGLSLALGLMVFQVNARADALVVDLNDIPDNTTSSADANNSFSEPSTADIAPDPAVVRDNLPTENRLKLLEQQITNLVQMNLPGKIDNLEQQLHQLNGQIEEQNHTIQLMQDSLQNKNAQEQITPSQVASVSKKSNSIVPTEVVSSTTAAATEGADTNEITRKETALLQNKPIPNDTPNDSDAKAYQAAFDLMAKKQNLPAITAFEAFLKDHPQSAYSANAHYWLGVLYVTTNKNDSAAKEFSTLIRKYPTYANLPDAMLKLATIHEDAGQYTQAKKEFEKIVDQFPNSTAARLAKMYL